MAHPVEYYLVVLKKVSDTHAASTNGTRVSPDKIRCANQNKTSFLQLLTNSEFIATEKLSRLLIKERGTYSNTHFVTFTLLSN